MSSRKKAAKDGKVDSAKIVDGEQRVDLTLKQADGDNGTQVQFYYVAPRGACAAARSGAGDRNADRVRRG